MGLGRILALWKAGRFLPPAAARCSALVCAGFVQNDPRAGADGVAFQVQTMTWLEGSVRASAALGTVVFVAFMARLMTGFLEKRMGQEAWKAFVKENFLLIYAIPAASTAAFAIVLFFGFVTPGTIKFRFLELSVEGPAVPPLIWIVVFLSFILAIRLLRPK